MSETERPAPKISVSYAWEDEAHMQWVGEFATPLRGDGIDVSLDQWMVGLGKALPEFMEKLVRENERVLVICTPTYKEKSDGRDWTESIPSWLSGKAGVDLRGDEYSESEYHKLVNELQGRTPQPPPLGPVPASPTTGGGHRTGAMPAPPPQETSGPIKIVGVVEEEVTSPRNDSTRGSALYAVPFQLSRHPSSKWAERFVENWNHPPAFTTVHRPGIARVHDDRIILEGTTMDEVERYHAKTLKLALQKTNKEAAAEEERQRQLAEQKRKSKLEHRNSVGEILKRLKFD